MRIIVDIKDDIDPALALDALKQVVKEGKISEAAGVNHYCWATLFRYDYDPPSNGYYKIVVATRRKKKEQTSESFVVYKEQQ